MNEISGDFEISRFQFSSPGDWKDGRNPVFTTGDGKDPVNCGGNYLSTGAGFRSSTGCWKNFAEVV